MGQFCIERQLSCVTRLKEHLQTCTAVGDLDRFDRTLLTDSNLPRRCMRSYTLVTHLPLFHRVFFLFSPFTLMVHHHCLLWYIGSDVRDGEMLPTAIRRKSSKYEILVQLFLVVSFCFGFPYHVTVCLHHMERVLLLPSWTIFIIRSYSVRINSSLFFVCIPEELRLSLYRNVSKHTEVNSVCNFFYRRESANFRKGQGKLMFNDSSNFETYRQE